MKYHHQLCRHDPDNGQYGDCFRTAVACLLDLHPSDVPHFADDPEQNMWDRARNWVDEWAGLNLFMFPQAGERDEIMNNMEVLNAGQAYMLMGLSRDGNGHVVLCRNNQVIHDPSWAQQSVVAPYPDGYYLVAVLTQGWVHN